MILKTYSKPLYEFYKEYARWLEGESVYEFSPYVGLCANLSSSYTKGVIHA